LQVLALLA